jgi:thiosulfate/3-mercaptopyruvate sulfurtransferase
MTSPLVSTDWLHQHKDDPNLVLIKATIGKIIGKEPILYEAPVFISNSIVVDVEEDLTDLASSSVHAFPTEPQFNAVAARLGITSDQTIVIYDDQGIYASPRIWWIFKAFGVENVFILNGGLPKWMAEGKEVTSEPTSAEPKTLDQNFTFQEDLVRSTDFVLDNLQTQQSILVDARAANRFLGLVEEPRAGVRSGHIPKSLNLPFGEVFDGHCFKSKEELKQLFDTFSPDQQQPYVFSCGSGITGCIILVAALIAGRSSVSLYDGSWSEWGSDSSLPIE